MPPDTSPPDRRGRGPAIRAFRLARGLTLTQLAEKVSFHKGHLSHVESGRYRASVKHTAELAAALNVDADVLTGQVPPIEALRDILGLDAAVLARSAEMTPARLARVERGTERPHPVELERIARRLGVDPAALGADTVEAVAG